MHLFAASAVGSNILNLLGLGSNNTQVVISHHMCLITQTAILSPTLKGPDRLFSGISLWVSGVVRVV